MTVSRKRFVQQAANLKLGLLINYFHVGRSRSPLRVELIKGHRRSPRKRNKATPESRVGMRPGEYAIMKLRQHAKCSSPVQRRLYLFALFRPEQ